MPIHRKIDLSGTTINTLFIIKQTSRDKYYDIVYLCKCSCGVEFESTHNMLVRKNNPTQSCGCKHRSAKDITGQRFGMLLVISRLDNTKYGSVWRCKCDCGNIKDITYKYIKSGVITCGCRPPPSQDLTNQRFGRLISLERVEVRNGDAIWKCKCDCGNVKNIYASSLKATGKGKGTKSCGCLRHEQCVENGMKLADLHSRCRRDFYLNGVKFRSGYEYIYAEYLTSKGIKWLYEPIRFYLSKFSYTPDFFLPETNEWVEVKGYFLDKSKEKAELFERETCVKLKFIFYEDILKIKPDYIKWIRSIPIILSESKKNSSSDPLAQIQVTYSSDDS